MQTSYVGSQPVQFGDLKVAILLGVGGPASYAIATGDPVSNPASGDYIAFPMQAWTVSKNYEVDFAPATVGDIRAGATSGMQSGWTAFWVYSGNEGIATTVQNVAGSGMTPGNVGTITFSGTGSGATGTFTVLTATTGTIAITNTGSGYTGTPTAVVTGTGGTPPTVTVTAAPASGPVAAGTNLSLESVQFGALITER